MLNLALAEAKVRSLRINDSSIPKNDISDPFCENYGEANRSPSYIKKTLKELPFAEFRDGFWYFKDDKVAIVPMMQSILSGERTVDEFAEIFDRDPKDIKKCLKFFAKNKEEFSEWQKKKAVN